MILQFGVHGFHEWFTCMHPGVLGIPKVLRELVRAVPLQRPRRARRSVRAPPRPGRRDRHGADDVRATRPRVPRGVDRAGPLAWCPGRVRRDGDRACGSQTAAPRSSSVSRPTSPASARGSPTACRCRRWSAGATTWSCCRRVAYGMTFRGETLSLAAARAVLQTLRERAGCAALARIGAAAAQRLRAGVRGGRCAGAAARPRFPHGVRVRERRRHRGRAGAGGVPGAMCARTASSRTGPCCRHWHTTSRRSLARWPRSRRLHARRGAGRSRARRDRRVDGTVLQP